MATRIEPSPTNTLTPRAQVPDQVTRESEQVSEVLREVREMKMNPEDNVPTYPARRVFWRLFRPTAAVAVSIPLTLCAVEYLISDISPLELIAAPVVWAVTVLFLAILIGIVVVLITACQGERIEDEGYHVRVLHDHRNAARLLRFTDEVLGHAAVHVKRTVDWRTEVRNYMIVFLVGAEGVIGAVLNGFQDSQRLFAANGPSPLRGVERPHPIHRADARAPVAAEIAVPALDHRAGTED